MLNSYSLKIFSKKKIQDNNNNTIVDLTRRSINLDSASNVNFITYVIVNDRYEARPHLISYDYYNTTEYYDIILKFNGISNPYSIQEGDIIFIPDLNTALNSVKDDLDIYDYLNSDNVFTSDNNIRNVFKKIDNKNYDPISDFNNVFDKMITDKKIQEDGTRLPPNISDFGDKQFIVKGGSVHFAPDVTKCNVPPTKGEFVSRLIKNKIIG